MTSSASAADRPPTQADSEEERALLERMKNMIDMQYRQQSIPPNHQESPLSLKNSTALANMTSRTLDQPVDTENQSEQPISKMSKTSSRPALLAAAGEGAAGLATAGRTTLDAYVESPISPYSGTGSAAGVSVSNDPEAIGRGTLHIPPQYQSQWEGGQPGPYHGSNDDRNVAPPNGPGERQDGMQQPPAAYGTMSGQHTEQYQQLHLPEVGNGHAHQNYQHHPDNENDPYMEEYMQPRQGGSDQPFVQQCCSCIYEPILYYLTLEHLQRSFCFGAIDGLLTGSGIVGALSGMDILGLTTNYETRLAVVGLSISACMADAICMAFGHVWNSYVVSSGHAQERSKARHELNLQKVEAKAQLVDMLMARGVLKIDAMSLADTLEGYPDLFINTIVGDSLMGPTHFEEGYNDDDSQPLEHSAPDGGHGAENSPLLGMIGVRRPSDDFRRSGLFSWAYPSYGQFDSIEQDPEFRNVNMVLQESRREGFFMLTGFVTFAVLPSLLWLFVPTLVGTDPSLPAHSRATHGSGDAVSLPSLIVTLSAVIMWFLGIWKSKFLDADNWILFGIQTVVVLLICVASSFGMGKLCSVTFLKVVDTNYLLRIN